MDIFKMFEQNSQFTKKQQCTTPFGNFENFGQSIESIFQNLDRVYPYLILDQKLATQVLGSPSIAAVSMSGFTSHIAVSGPVIRPT